MLISRGDGAWGGIYWAQMGSEGKGNSSCPLTSCYFIGKSVLVRLEAGRFSSSKWKQTDPLLQQRSSGANNRIHELLKEPQRGTALNEMLVCRSYQTRFSSHVSPLLVSKPLAGRDIHDFRS